MARNRIVLRNERRAELVEIGEVGRDEATSRLNRSGLYCASSHSATHRSVISEAVVVTSAMLAPISLRPIPNASAVKSAVSFRLVLLNRCRSSGRR